MQRAKANGKAFGRPRISTDRIDLAKRLRSEGLTFAEVGERMGISRVRAYQLCNE